MTEPSLSIVPFRRVPAKGDADLHNQRLVGALQRDGRVYVTGAVIDGSWCLRPCIVNYRTTEGDHRALAPRHTAAAQGTTPALRARGGARWAAASRTRSRRPLRGQAPCRGLAP